MFDSILKILDIKKRGPRFSKSNKNVLKDYLKILSGSSLLNGP